MGDEAVLIGSHEAEAIGAEEIARLRCPECRQERLVMFSCRIRGFCPSCHAKRIEE